jgi:pimeloyl-ACP methyl ester carboxylesterase
MPFNSLDTARANAQNLPDDLRGVLLNYTEQMFSICDKWGAGVADPIENAPVVSDIPTLIFAGEFDPITPPKWGEQAAAYLHHSYFFQFPGIGHGVLGVNGCSLRIAGAFLDHPAVKPRSECLAYVKEPNFGVP